MVSMENRSLQTGPERDAGRVSMAGYTREVIAMQRYPGARVPDAPASRTRAPVRKDEWKRFVEHLRACDGERAGNVSVSSVLEFMRGGAEPPAIAEPRPVRIDYVSRALLPQALAATPVSMRNVPHRSDASCRESTLPAPPALDDDDSTDMSVSGDDADDIPSSWIDDDEEISIDDVHGAVEMDAGAEDDWAPQALVFSEPFVQEPDEAGEEPAAGIGEEQKGMPKPLKEHSTADETEEDVPRRSVSLEDAYALRRARREKVDYANTIMSFLPEVDVKRPGKLAFHRYQVLTEYDKLEALVNAEENQGGSQMPLRRQRVFYAKTHDGNEADLSAGALYEAEFLRPRIAYRMKDGLKVRMPHFEFVQVPSRATSPLVNAGEGSLESDPESDREDTSSSMPGSWPRLSPHSYLSWAGHEGGYLRGTDSSDDEGLY